MVHVVLFFLHTLCTYGTITLATKDSLGFRNMHLKIEILILNWNPSNCSLSIICCSSNLVAYRRYVHDFGFLTHPIL